MASLLPQPLLERLANTRQLLGDPQSGLAGNKEVECFVEAMEVTQRLHSLLLDEQGRPLQGVSLLDKKKVWGNGMRQGKCAGAASAPPAAATCQQPRRRPLPQRPDLRPSASHLAAAGNCSLCSHPPPECSDYISAPQLLQRPHRSGVWRAARCSCLWVCFEALHQLILEAPTVAPPALVVQGMNIRSACGNAGGHHLAEMGVETLILGTACSMILSEAAGGYAVSADGAGHWLSMADEDPMFEPALDRALAELRPDIPLTGRQLVLTMVAVQANACLQLCSTPTPPPARLAAAEACTMRLLA